MFLLLQALTWPQKLLTEAQWVRLVLAEASARGLLFAVEQRS